MAYTEVVYVIVADFPEGHPAGIPAYWSGPIKSTLTGFKANESGLDHRRDHARRFASEDEARTEALARQADGMFGEFTVEPFKESSTSMR